MKTGAEKAVDSIIRSLSSGFNSLSVMKCWVSASGFQISVAGGVLGAAGLVLTLVGDRKLGFPWLPYGDYDNKSTGEKLYLVPGLQNLGNNCFLNVILQALASCSYFQPYLQKVIKECESSSRGEWTESLQLAVALADLLEELCAYGETRVVLSPRKVMLAMAYHNEDFNLTNQQDAEEAFLHLLSSLREEFSDCYSQNQSSLADSFSSPNSRILTPKRHQIQYEQGKWQQHFLGPFDGILGSILTCHSCSTQISLNFQFFHSLPLSPVLGSGSSIMVGCTLEDCLKKFITAEQVENYKCSHCWHNAVIKYLSLKGVDEPNIEDIRRCDGQDYCTCRNLFHVESLLWTNNSSHTVKQLSVARCPKILSIHLQRATVNHFGEQVKLQGHINFPLMLNLAPFMLKSLQLQSCSPQQHTYNVQSDIKMLSQMYGQNVWSKVMMDDRFGFNQHSETIVGGSNSPQTRSSMFPCNDGSLQANDKDNKACQIVPSEPILYRLVSVVEHFGRVGGGHYTIYRSARLTSKSNKEDMDNSQKLSDLQWYCISDSKVYSVAEEDVLAAEASLLFYERV